MLLASIVILIDFILNMVKRHLCVTLAEKDSFLKHLSMNINGFTAQKIQNTKEEEIVEQAPPEVDQPT